MPHSSKNFLEDASPVEPFFRTKQLPAPLGSQILSKAATFLPLAMIGFHVLIALFPLCDQLINQHTHLCFSLVLIFLNLSVQRTRSTARAWFVSATLLTLVLFFYIAIYQNRLALTAGFPLPTDVLVGVGLMGLVVYGTWISFGAALPILVLAALAYAFWGHWLPGYAGHPHLAGEYIVSCLSVGFQGIYGPVLNASVTIIFLLVIFGALFEATGITAVFMQIGIFMGRKMRGGAGLAAVVASTLTGMLNGIAAANVAVTGFNTIPAMEAGGFNKKTAGAIEAAASTGGQLTPPVMGIAVFIIAGFLGVGCGRLMLQALVPAIAFYAVVILGIRLIAARESIPTGTTRENRRTIAAGLPVFALPLLVLGLLLGHDYAVGYAAFWAIISLLIAAGLQKATRPGWRTLLTGLSKGAALGATFGVACACIGMLFKCLTLTGTTSKIGLVITAAAGSSLWLPLVLTMLLCLLLGTCLPTVAAYAIAALTAVPVLTDIGILPPAAHFFVFYFGVMANIMPPISGASMVAARISGADYMATALESFKLALPFVPVPFFLIRNPVFFMKAQPLPAAIAALGALAVSMIALACFCQRCGRIPNSRFEQALLPVVSILATGYGLNGQHLFLSGSAALFCIYLAGQWIRFRQRAVGNSIMPAKEMNESIS